MITENFNFTTHSTKFFGKKFIINDCKSVIILVHGMGEHLGRYENSVIPTLTKNNYSVVAFDHFGHGKTEGKRGYCPSYNSILNSLESVIKITKEQFPNKSIFLYGHSMGGNVVLNFGLRRDSIIKGIISSSPFLKLAFQPPKWKISAAKLLQKIAPKVTLKNEIDTTKISRIEEEVKKYNNDPLIHDKINANFSISFIETGEWAIKNSNKLKVKTLLIHGTDDEIISYKGTEEFAKNSKLTDLKLYENGYHELHHDICKDEVLKDIVNWLNTNQ